MTFILILIFGALLFGMACEGLGAIIGIAIGIIRAINNAMEERRKP